VQEPACVADFRRNGTRWFLALCAFGFFVIPLSGLFAAGPDGKEEPSVVQQLICAPLAASMLWTTIGVIRQGIWIHPEGVRVRNAYRTYNLPWSDIEGIGPPLPYGAWRNAGIQFKLRDGGRISAALYSEGPLSSADFAADAVSRLQACHEQATAER
jgi:Bacterial PH domain